MLALYTKNAIYVTYKTLRHNLIEAANQNNLNEGFHWMLKKKILLVDDEKDFCYFVKLNLERSGKYLVHAAFNARTSLPRQWEASRILFLTQRQAPVYFQTDSPRKANEYNRWEPRHSPGGLLINPKSTSQCKSTVLIKTRKSIKFIRGIILVFCYDRGRKKHEKKELSGLKEFPQKAFRSLTAKLFSRIPGRQWPSLKRPREKREERDWVCPLRLWKVRFGAGTAISIYLPNDNEQGAWNGKAKIWKWKN